MSFAKVAGHRMRYDVGGPVGGPALVLSNSLGTNFGMWNQQVAVLAARWRVVRYDTRGHGGSGVTPGPYSVAQLASDVVGLLDHLGVPEADFCGLSLGGLVGLSLAHDHRDRIRKLIVCSAAAQMGTPALWDARIAAVRQGGMQAIASSVLARWFTDDFRVREPTLVGQIEAQLLATPTDGYAACCAAVREADLRQSLSAIRSPTLVLTGTVDPGVSTDAARWLAGHIPGAQYGELPTSHLSNVEDSAAFTSQVSRFLAA
jgi:3-oxoadipate enol-lactonase